MDTQPVVNPQASTVTINVQYDEKISRLFLFRDLWMFVEIWVLYVWVVWYGILTFLLFWYQLFLGKRHAGLWKRRVRLFRHLMKWNAYLMWLTNERPKFIED